MPRKDDGLDRVLEKLDSLKEHVDDHLGGMKERLGKVDDKLDRMDGRLDNLDVTSGKQQVILEDHIKRTELLEKKFDDEKKEMEKQLAPLKTQKTQITLAVKIGGALIAAGGLGGGGFFIKHFFAALFGGEH